MYANVCLDVCDWHVGFVFFCFNRIPEVGSQMAKHIVDTVNCILLFLFYCILLSVVLVNKRILNIRECTVRVTKFICFCQFFIYQLMHNRFALKEYENLH
jgi:hypothetical protein